MWRSYFLLGTVSFCLAGDLSGKQVDFSELDSLINRAIDRHTFPGAVVLVNYQGNTLYHKAFGHYTYDTTSPYITLDTLFDLASLTKVVATTHMAMILCDAQLLSLDDPVSTYLADFSSQGKEVICIKHLLNHTSGIREPWFYPTMSAHELWKAMLEYPLVSSPGSQYTYSSTNMIILHKVIEKITNLSFDEAIKNYITGPLQMVDTMFNPKDKERCAPTWSATWRGDCIQGEVNDPRAYMLGGIAGNAGLFSTARDLEKLMLMMLSEGSYDGQDDRQQLVRSATINAWVSHQGPCHRGYGWDIGRYLSSDAFGHTGWTGTSLWADKKIQLFCIVLTNRTYPHDDNLAIWDFRAAFHDLVMNSIMSN